MAASAFFASAAPELISGIFAACESLAQVRALMHASRHVHAVWLADAPHIIASIGPRAIPAFDMGLLVVRATDLVKQAQLAGEVPPEIDMSTLSSSSHPPSISEFRSVLGLRHLVHCLELQYCYAVEPNWCHSFATRRWPQDLYFTDPGWPPEPEKDPTCGPVYPPEVGEDNHRKWTARFTQAVYMALLIPAVLARAYNMPHAEKRGWSISDDGWENHRLPPAEVKHFCSFPAYDFHDKLGRHSEIYGPLSDWIVNSRLAALRASGDVMCLLRSGCHHSSEQPVEVCPATAQLWPRTKVKFPKHSLVLDKFAKGSQAEGEHVLWELMQALHAAEFVFGRLVSEERWDWRQWIDDYQLNRVSLPEEQVRGPKVALVPFGTFRAEEVQLPTAPPLNPAVAATLLLQAHPLEPPASSQMQKAPDIYCILDAIYMRGGVPNRYSVTSMPTPPPPLQFFQFLLKEHFGLAFYQGCFETSYNNSQSYESFRHKASIFANGPDDVVKRRWHDCWSGSEILTEHHDVDSGGLYYYEHGETNPRFYNSVLIPQ